MHKKLLLVAIAFGVLGLFAPLEAEANDNPLLGHWVRENSGPWWIGFEWIGFSKGLVQTDMVADIPVARYDITDGVARVHTRFGETYVFDLVEPDRICLPTAKIQELAGHDPATEYASRLCYVRTEQVYGIATVNLSGIVSLDDGCTVVAELPVSIGECVTLRLDKQ